MINIFDDSVITCDEIINATKIVPTSLIEKRETVKQKILSFTRLFINCYSIIDRC